MRPFSRHLPWLAAVALLPVLHAAPPVATQVPTTPEEKTMRAIYDEALLRSQAFENVRTLVTRFPGRLSGSPTLEHAVGWTRDTLTRLGMDTVTTPEVMVPHWERGAPESLFLLDGSGMTPLTACALGGSAGTDKDGLLAEVVEVQSLGELETLGRARIEGRIVFFSRPMDPTVVRPGHAYSGAGDQRTRGPAAAAKFGAAGALVRSLTHRLDDTPHTGVTIFPVGTPKIPAAALSTLAADRLAAALAEGRRNGTPVRVGIKIHARWFPDAVSHNVIGDLRGAEFPNEVILVGGHLDAWDIAPGAHDDAAGIAQSLEVIRIFRALGIKPRHTLRFVAFTNEENGTAGAKAYAKSVAERQEKHLLAIESDNGGFQPHAIMLANTGNDAAARADRWLPLLRPYGIYEFRQGYAGTDVTPLLTLGAVTAEAVSDSQRYFDLHHTKDDTLDKVNPRELQLGAAAMTALAWLADTQGI